MKQTDFAERLTQALDLRGLSAAEFAGHILSVETEKDPATGGEVLEDDLRHYSTVRTKEKAPQTIAVVYRGSCLKVRAEALTNRFT